MKAEDLKWLMEQFSIPVTFNECVIIKRDESGVERSYAGDEIMALALDYIERLEQRVAFKDADDETKWCHIRHAEVARERATREANDLRAQNKRQSEVIKSLQEPKEDIPW